MPGAGVVDGWREVQTHGFHAREGRVQGSRGRGGRRRPTQAAGPSGGRALAPCPQLGTKDSSHQRTGARTAQGLRFLTLRGSALWPPLAPVAAALPTVGEGHRPAGLQVARLPDGVRLTLRSCGEASGEGPRQPGRQHRRPRGLWLACRTVREERSKACHALEDSAFGNNFKLEKSCKNIFVFPSIFFSLPFFNFSVFLFCYSIQ